MSSLITRFRKKIAIGFTILLIVGLVLQGCRKAEGYTFIDCGTGGASSASAFYDMELSQLF